MIGQREARTPREQRPRERERARIADVRVEAGVGWYGNIKRGLELFAAVVLFLVTLPFLVAAALAVKLTSRGPILYSQTRLGLNGRPYTIYKLRSMAHDCERTTGAQWAKPDDPRITLVGRFLRASHVDELPQLWNVLRGEMSLVGPRPERPEFVPSLDKAIPGYRYRLRVRPGVTGLAQVLLPADSDLDSVRRKLAYDLFYVRHQGFVLDLKILLSTVLAVVGLPFVIAQILFRLPSLDDVSGAERAAQTQPAYRQQRVRLQTNP